MSGKELKSQGRKNGEGLEWKVNNCSPPSTCLHPQPLCSTPSYKWCFQFLQRKFNNTLFTSPPVILFSFLRTAHVPWELKSFLFIVKLQQTYEHDAGAIRWIKRAFHAACGWPGSNCPNYNASFLNPYFQLYPRSFLSWLIDHFKLVTILRERHSSLKWHDVKHQSGWSNSNAVGGKGNKSSPAVFFTIALVITC